MNRSNRRFWTCWGWSIAGAVLAILGAWVLRDNANWSGGVNAVMIVLPVGGFGLIVGLLWAVFRLIPDR